MSSFIHLVFHSFKNKSPLCTDSGKVTSEKQTLLSKCSNQIKYNHLPATHLSQMPKCHNYGMYKIPRNTILPVEYQEWLFGETDSLNIDKNSQAPEGKNACSKQRKKNERRNWEWVWRALDAIPWRLNSFIKVMQTLKNALNQRSYMVIFTMQKYPHDCQVCLKMVWEEREWDHYSEGDLSGGCCNGLSKVEGVCICTGWRE